MTPTPSEYSFARHTTLYQSAQRQDRAGSRVALADIRPEFTSLTLDGGQEADINAPDLSALLKPRVALKSARPLRDGLQHSLLCSGPSKQSMDENNCCVAVRIFIEKNGKYIFR